MLRARLGPLPSNVAFPLHGFIAPNHPITDFETEGLFSPAVQGSRDTTLFVKLATGQRAICQLRLQSEILQHNPWMH